MRKITALYTSLILIIAAISPVSAYLPKEDIEIITLSITNQEGDVISQIASPEDIIDISVLVKNWYLDDTTVNMYTVVSDSETGKIRGIKETKGGLLKKYSKMKLEASLDLSGMNGVEAGDLMDIYFWNSLGGMQQLKNNISLETPQNSIYSTNNITEYNSETNVVEGDSWSYHAWNGTIGDESVKPAFGLCVNLSGRWHLAASRTDTWYLKGDGSSLNESNRILAWNYTIGEHTAEKKLTLKGTFSGSAEANLLVMKSSDTDISSVNFISIESAKLDKVYKAASEAVNFEIVIPASEAVYGKDITFAVVPTSGGYHTTKLDVTITAKEVPSKKTNSIENFSSENVIGGGLWSYIDKPVFMLNEDSADMGILSYEKLMLKGDGITYAENEFTSDLTDTDKMCYIKPDGSIYTGKHAVAFVYTLDKDFVGADQITVSAKGKKATNNYILTILKTSDGDENTIGSEAKLLYTGTAKEHDLSAQIGAEEFNIGDDIVFIVESKAATYWLAIGTEFNINAQFSEE